MRSTRECALLGALLLLALLALSSAAAASVDGPPLRDHHRARANLHADADLLDQSPTDARRAWVGFFGVGLLVASVLLHLYLRRVPRPPPNGRVVSVSLSAEHTFSKQPQPRIHLITGLGVEGDCHLGKLVQHRSRLATRGHEPNLRQVHLIHQELHTYAAAHGYPGLKAGDLGENVLTQGVDLLSLPTGTRLYIGSEVLLEVTGLRNPCPQIDNFREGLMTTLKPEDAEGNVKRLAGVMAVIVAGGNVQPGDTIRVELPRLPHKPLEAV